MSSSGPKAGALLLAAAVLQLSAPVALGSRLHLHEATSHLREATTLRAAFRSDGGGEKICEATAEVWRLLTVERSVAAVTGIDWAKAEAVIHHSLAASRSEVDRMKAKLDRGQESVERAIRRGGRGGPRQRQAEVELIRVGLELQSAYSVQSSCERLRDFVRDLREKIEEKAAAKAERDKEFVAVKNDWEGATRRRDELQEELEALRKKQESVEDVQEELVADLKKKELELVKRNELVEDLAGRGGLQRLNGGARQGARGGERSMEIWRTLTVEASAPAVRGINWTHVDALIDRSLTDWSNQIARLKAQFPGREEALAAARRQGGREGSAVQPAETALARLEGELQAAYRGQSAWEDARNIVRGVREMIKEEETTMDKRFQEYVAAENDLKDAIRRRDELQELEALKKKQEESVEDLRKKLREATESYDASKEGLVRVYQEAMS